MDRDIFQATVDRYAPPAYSFADDAVEINENELETIFADLRREARRIPSIVSLYMDDGGIKAGPRSIQLITVYDASKCEPGSFEQHDLLRTVGTRNIFEPDCISVDETLMHAWPKFECLLQPTHIGGKKINFPSLQATEMRFFYLSRLLDFFSTGWLEPFIQAEIERRVHVRGVFAALQRLHSVIETTKVIMRRGQEEFPVWDTFLRKVEHLANRWFSCGIERYKGLMPLISEGLYVAFNLIGELDTYCTKARVVNLTTDKDAQPPQALLVTDDDATAYISDWDPAKGLELTLLCSQEMGRFVSVLPTAFSLQLYEYSKGKGKFPAFSRYLQGVFGTDGVSGNMERSYVSWERGEMIDRLQSFLTKVGARTDHGYTFACNVRGRGAISAAAGLMATHRNTQRLKTDMKTLKTAMANYRGETLPATGDD